MTLLMEKGIYIHILCKKCWDPFIVLGSATKPLAVSCLHPLMASAKTPISSITAAASNVDWTSYTLCPNPSAPAGNWPEFRASEMVP